MIGRRINLIVRDNGLGLSRDARLLASALEALGCNITCTRLGEADEIARWRHGHGWRAQLAKARHAWARWRGRTSFDFNIHFEHLWPLHLPLAQRNLALPNPEWFDAYDRRHLCCIDTVWAKTRHAEQIFRKLGCTVRWIGFASEDVALPESPCQHAFFHLAGGSRTKGTDALLALWRRHPEWPPLTVVRHSGSGKAEPAAANLHLITDYLDKMQLRALQNSHAFHLCPSQTEGYGHYLTEAMSAGAVAIATDAPPMNEILGAQRGLLVTAMEAGQQGLATLYCFDDAAMERAVAACLDMDDARIASIGGCARAWFVENQTAFPARVAAALAALLR